jgi:SAM-dependent methyltransferase
MEENASSVIHPEAYRNYFRTHFGKYQSLDPADTLGSYSASFSAALPSDKAARILELGSGLGKFAYFLKKSGYTDVTCVDISAELAALAKKHSGVDVLVVAEPMDFLRAQPENSYDRVFILDVIEHIRKEKVLEYLALIRRALKPGGVLHLTTENIASPVGGRIQQYLDFTHEYNYSEVSLRQTLEIAGFSKIDIHGQPEYFYGIRSVLYWLARKVLYGIYRVVYEVERPGMVNPVIYSKELAASAAKE